MPGSSPGMTAKFPTGTKRRADQSTGRANARPMIKLRAIRRYGFSQGGGLRPSGRALRGPVGLIRPTTLSLNLRLQRILDHAIEGRRLWRGLVALFGDESVALGDQAGELFVQRVALLHLPVEFVHALLGFQRAQIFR